MGATSRRRWGVLYGSFLFGAVNYKNMPVLFAHLQDSLHLDPLALGDVLGFQGACHVVAVCVFGHMVSRVRSRLGLLATCATCWAVGTLLTAASLNLAMLMFGRAFVGFSSGVVGPVSQFLVAEWTPPAHRGRVFGRVVALDFVGQALAAAGLAYIIAQVGSWRIALAILAGATLFFAVSAQIVAGGERREEAPVVPGTSWIAQVASVLRTPSFRVLILQGFLASTQKEANAFVCLWLQQCGYSATTAASMYSALTLGNVTGCVCAGTLADRLAARFPNYGRIVFGQLGDLFRLSALCVLLHIAPMGNASATVTCCALYGLMQSVNYVGAVRPLLTEVVSPSLIALAIALAATIDGAFASMAAGPVVGWCSQHWFGYRPGEFSVHNRKSLQAALGSVLLIGCAGTVFAFSLLYRTLPRDRAIALASAKAKVSSEATAAAAAAAAVLEDGEWPKTPQPRRSESPTVLTPECSTPLKLFHASSSLESPVPTRLRKDTFHSVDADLAHAGMAPKLISPRAELHVPLLHQNGGSRTTTAARGRRCLRAQASDPTPMPCVRAEVQALLAAPAPCLSLRIPT